MSYRKEINTTQPPKCNCGDNAELRAAIAWYNEARLKYEDARLALENKIIEMTGIAKEATSQQILAALPAEVSEAEIDSLFES